MASLLTLTSSQPTLTLAPGDVLIAEGELGGDMYVLESGRLTVERGGVTLATISAPGALVGEMSVLLGTENTATVRAEAATTLRVVKDALAYLERQPLVALRVAMLLSQRLDATSAALVDLAHQKKAEPSLYASLMAAMSTDRN